MAAPVSIVSEDGTKTAVVNSDGSLSVNLVAADGVSVAGPDASDAPITGNPVLCGARASTATPTAVSGDGDAVALWASREGAQVVGIRSVTTNHADGFTNDSLAIATNAFGTTMIAPVYNYCYNGTSWDRVRGTTRGMNVVGNGGRSASAVFTPAAASHTANDVVGGAQLFDLNAPASCLFEITSASLLIANATIETTAWTLHLFSATPPSAVADDGAYTLPSGDHATYLGFITLPQVVDYVDSLYIEVNNIGKQVQLAASGDLFGYLVNGTTLTPGAVAHTVKLMGRPV